MRKTSIMLLAAALPFAFIAGLITSEPIRSVAALLSGERHPHCVDQYVCVGSEAPGILLSINTNKHGLSYINCDDAPQDRADSTLFLDRVVKGEKCSSQNITVEFRNSVTKTLVKINRGYIIEIKESPSLDIDT